MCDDLIFLRLNDNCIIENNTDEIASKSDSLLWKLSRLNLYEAIDGKTIKNLLKDNSYYIIYQNYIIKEKKRVFKGKIIKVNRNEVIIFIERAMYGVDKNYLIVPEVKEPTYLISVYDDDKVRFYHHF